MHMAAVALVGKIFAEHSHQARRARRKNQKQSLQSIMDTLIEALGECFFDV
jgi:hypothetical protein